MAIVRNVIGITSWTNIRTSGESSCTAKGRKKRFKRFDCEVLLLLTLFLLQLHSPTGLELLRNASYFYLISPVYSTFFLLILFYSHRNIIISIFLFYYQQPSRNILWIFNWLAHFEKKKDLLILSGDMAIFCLRGWFGV